MITYEAVYKDTEDKSIAAYICPVVWDGKSWMLQTFDGLKPITYYIPADDAPSGLIEFEDFKATIENGIRACDIKWRDIPRPVKPAVKPEPSIVQTSAPVHKADNWNPKPLSIPGSKSTQLDERWQPRFHKLNLERTTHGDLMVGKCLGVNPDSKERFYSCQCSCGKTIQATQSDLLLKRVTSCDANNPQPATPRAVIA